MVLEFDLESQEPTDTSEALHELEALLRFVGNELKFGSKAGIVIAKPLGERLSLYHIIRDSG